MSVDIVKNISLFISKKSIKSLPIKLKFFNDTVYSGDRSNSLMCSTTSHYSLPMTKWDLEVENTNIILHTKHIRDLRKTGEKRQHKSCIDSLYML